MQKEIFDINQLEQIVNNRASEYQSATPFSHVVIKDLFDINVLHNLALKFPNITSETWSEFKNPTENLKLVSHKYELIPIEIRSFLDTLNSATFINFLEKLTGIPNLITDPNYEGGGMHQVKDGGSLSIHVDFNKHPKLNLYRRINVLLYLNKDWRNEYGGHLELWDNGVKRLYQKVPPEINTMVIFTTSEGSQHGHPDPMTLPDGITRKSLAWYYYTVEKPDNINEEAHSTLYSNRPHKDGFIVKNKIKDIIRDLLPPILHKQYIKIKRKINL